MAAYVPLAGFAIRPPIEPIVPTRPAPWRRMTGATARTIRITPRTFTSNIACTPSSPTSSTKHAVEALSDALRVELGMFGIDVVLIEPGNIRSSFGETADRASAPILDRLDSPYASLYAGCAAATARLRAHEPGPEIVAKVVLDALTARRPSARYRAGVPLATRLVLALPDVGRDAMMRRLYGTGRQSGTNRG